MPEQLDEQRFECAMAIKSSGGIRTALGMTGLVLSMSGYVAGAAQADSALFGIRFLLGPISAVIFGLAIFTLWRYPINEERYNEILEKIKQMEIGRD